MSFRDHLGWNVPSSVWERHESRAVEKHGFSDLYTGVEAELIARLWIEIEETDPSALALPTDTPPHTQEKKVSDTPLSEQEKVKVQVRFNPDLKEEISVYADKYDENEGVLLGYILREYYETDGWGYSIEAVGSTSLSEQSDEETDTDIPYAESDKKDWICDRLEPGPDGATHEDQIRDLIRKAGAESRVNHYLPDVLDRLNYVHHPTANGLYIPCQDLYEEHGLSIDDPAIYRKPVEALSREERIEGIKAILSTRKTAMPVDRIHSEIFDGNWSKSHIRNLVTTIADSEGATYKPTAGGTMVLRVDPCGYPPEPEHRSEPEPEPEPELEPADTTDDQEQDQNQDIESEAASEMKLLMESEPARTDGGVDGG